MESHLLEVKNVDLFHGDAQAVWNVSFHVDRGRIIALVGANGAGKSTILNAVSCFMRPGRGEIFFAGKSLASVKPEEAVALGVSQVPEGRRLFARLTVKENLGLGAYPANARPYLKESLNRVFQLFPRLKDRVDQSAGTLSGGEQQMLAIARALMARPSLLMLDEPSLGLAPLLVGHLFDIIRDLRKEGVTILLVEQNVHQTLEISDYAYVLKTGALDMEGSAAELLLNANFQKAFLGMVG